jgi:PucR family transcriptional regulator, purine catabolism regulatory protein
VRNERRSPEHMTDPSLAYLPSIQQLLETEVMTEAQILSGQDLLSRPVSQIVTSLRQPLRPHSLLVCRLESIAVKDGAGLVGLAGIVLVKANADESGSKAAIQVGSAALSLPHSAEHPLEKLNKLCGDAGLPLITIAGFGELHQYAEDLRHAYLIETRTNAVRLHAHFLKTVLTDGLEGLVEQLSICTHRPISIETVHFEVLAARNLGAMPASQQRTVGEQCAALVQRMKQTPVQFGFFGPILMNGIKIGRRLILPILLDDDLVGYISAMTRANDNLEALSEYLQPATSAATIDFYQRRKDGSIFTVTQNSLLKDLLTGRGLSASDQERLERHYGFDLCDGLLVFAVSASSSDPIKPADLGSETLATTEVEGTRIFVLPYNHKDGKTWQQIAADLVNSLKRSSTDKDTKSELKFQLGAGRLTDNILGLTEAYREARQTLIVGSMMKGNDQFITGYEALGVKRLLYLMIDHPELERFYEENLALLERYDEEYESELVSSLRIYLDEGANLNSAARALFIHRHTLRYRLEQIADILKVDIDSQESILNLQIAFLIKDMKFGAA